MGRKCVVPECRSNYNKSSTYISVYRFPKNQELCKTWIKLIRHENVRVSPHVGVCKLHFKESDFVTQSYACYGRMKTPRLRLLMQPKLKKDAVPSVFAFNEMQDDVFHNLDKLEKDINIVTFLPASNNVDKQWSALSVNGTHYIYLLSTSVPISINKSMILQWDSRLSSYSVDMYVGSVSIPKTLYKHLLCKEQVLLASQLTNLVTFLINYDTTASHTNFTKSLAAMLRHWNADFNKNGSHGNFLAEQLELLE